MPIARAVYAEQDITQAASKEEAGPGSESTRQGTRGSAAR